MLRWAEVVPTLRAAERWLLPAECLLCQQPITLPNEDPLICALCRLRWPVIPAPWCDRCGQPLDRDIECRVCEGWPEGFGVVRSAVWLTGGARAAVHHLKYGGWPRTTEAMALAMRGLAPLAGNPVLVPVPLGKARHRERGYNQCDHLAVALAGVAGGRVRPELLSRSRETRRQTGLHPDARRANTDGAFQARRPPPRTRVVLVDDVFTTGATLIGAAMALLAAGAEQVDAVTFARARRPLDDDVATLPLTPDP